MSHKGLYQCGLLCAVLTTLGWVAFVAGMVGGSAPPGAGLVEEYLANAASTGTLLYLWGGVLGSLAVIPVFVALAVGFIRETGSILLAPITLAIVGTGFLTLGFTVDVGSSVYYFSPAVAEADPQTAAAMVQAAQIAQDSIEATWAIGSFLAYGGPFVWLAILLFRASRVPAWLNWIGIIGGLGGFVWIGSFVPLPPIGPLPLLLNIVLGMVWLLGVSLILVRTGATEGSRTTETVFAP